MGRLQADYPDRGLRAHRAGELMGMAEPIRVVFAMFSIMFGKSMSER